MEPSPADQARAFWIARRILSRGDVPPDVIVYSAADARQVAVQALCGLGSFTTLPRLRARIMREWPAMVPVPPMPGGAA